MASRTCDGRWNMTRYRRLASLPTCASQHLTPHTTSELAMLHHPRTPGHQRGTHQVSWLGIASGNCLNQRVHHMPWVLGHCVCQIKLLPSASATSWVERSHPVHDPVYTMYLAANHSFPYSLRVASGRRSHTRRSWSAADRTMPVSKNPGSMMDTSTFHTRISLRSASEYASRACLDAQ